MFDLGPSGYSVEKSFKEDEVTQGDWSSFPRGKTGLGQEDSSEDGEE